MQVLFSMPEIRRKDGLSPSFRVLTYDAAMPQQDYFASVIFTTRDEVMPDAMPVAS
jgi:hypothetical protein